jgi:tRNA U34 5-methylaminomethyl-2-thiouridine-forming methyltransferase MnmC
MGVGELLDKNMTTGKTPAPNGGDHGLIWQDGQPLSSLYGDPFYSRHDGQAETRHVFIDGNNLIARLAEAKNFTIAELGFGTGLNLLETWHLWQHVRRQSARLHFVSFEKHPLSKSEIARAVLPWSALESEAASLVARWPDNPSGQELIETELDAQTALTVVIGDANLTVPAWQILADAWFLDGFSPAKNPEMWSEKLMQAVFEKTGPGGTFATYTAAGWVRRNLKAAGFIVEKRRGHGFKRDMAVGTKP